jgi:hypothetical protein
MNKRRKNKKIVNMCSKNLKQYADLNRGAMETRDHFKNGASPKSQRNRRNTMKKTFCILITFCINIASVFAQDIITLKNGDEIKAKVQEIGISEVKYKKYENLTGPVYTLMKTDIFMIKYENGEKDVFATQSQPAQEPVQEKQTPPTVSSNVKQNERSSINNMTKQGLPSRNKFYEIGIKSDIGWGLFYVSDENKKYKDEYNFGVAGGGGFFCDFYPGKMYDVLVGTGISCWGHYYTTDYNANYTFSYINWDIYFGTRNRLKISRANIKVGLRLNFLTSVIGTTTKGTTTDKSFFNPVVLGMVTEWGYSYKRFDIGANMFLMLSNIWKSDAFSDSDFSSGILGMAFTVSYRFPF